MIAKQFLNLENKQQMFISNKVKKNERTAIIFCLLISSGHGKNIHLIKL